MARGRRLEGETLREADLALALFPGWPMQATRYRLAFDPALSQFSATPLDGRFAGRTTRYAAQADPADASLFIPEIPVRSSAFGATVDRHATRLRVGADGALYAEISASSVGVTLFLPSLGVARIWGRWEPATGAAAAP